MSNVENPFLPTHAWTTQILCWLSEYIEKQRNKSSFWVSNWGTSYNSCGLLGLFTKASSARVVITAVLISHLKYMQKISGYAVTPFVSGPTFCASQHYWASMRSKWLDIGQVICLCDAKKKNRNVLFQKISIPPRMESFWFKPLPPTPLKISSSASYSPLKILAFEIPHTPHNFQWLSMG